MFSSCLFSRVGLVFFLHQENTSKPIKNNLIELVWILYFFSRNSNKIKLMMMNKLMNWIDIFQTFNSYIKKDTQASIKYIKIEKYISIWHVF